MSNLVAVSCASVAATLFAVQSIELLAAGQRSIAYDNIERLEREWKSDERVRAMFPDDRVSGELVELRAGIRENHRAWFDQERSRQLEFNKKSTLACAFTRAPEIEWAARKFFTQK